MTCEAPRSSARSPERPPERLPDCGPLFADGYVDFRRAFETLGALRSALQRPLWAIYRGRGRPEFQQRTTFEDFVHDVLQNVLIHKIVPQRGLRASSGEVAQPFGFLRQVVVREALSALRRHEVSVVVWSKGDADPVERQPAPVLETPEARLVWRREEALVRAAARDPATDLRPNLRFAFLAQCFPDDLEPAHVDAAKASAGQKVGQGLLRPGPEVWRLFEAHVRALGRVPVLEAEGRLAFAWICRSRDATDPETWQAHAPGEAARALDTTDEWLNRAGRKLLSQLPESVVHAWREGSA